MNTTELLQAARDLIADERHWTQYAVARDSAGNSRSYDDPSATRWCAVGTMYRTADEGNVPLKEEYQAFECLGTAARHLHDHSTIYVNDYLGYAATLEVFDEAIRRCEGITENDVEKGASGDGCH